MQNLILYLIASFLILLLVRRLKKTNNQKLAILSKSSKKQNKQIEKYILQTAISKGARWFYWIAGLSAANTLLYLFHGNIQFPVGLFVAQIVDVFTQDFGLIEVGLVMNAVIISLFVLIGYKTTQLNKVAFIVGLILYLLDLLVLVLFMVLSQSFTEFIVNIVFHLLALKSIYHSMRLLQKKALLHKLANST